MIKLVPELENFSRSEVEDKGVNLSEEYSGELVILMGCTTISFIDVDKILNTVVVNMGDIKFYSNELYFKYTTSLKILGIEIESRPDYSSLITRTIPSSDEVVLHNYKSLRIPLIVLGEDMYLLPIISKKRYFITTPLGEKYILSLNRDSDEVLIKIYKNTEFSSNGLSKSVVVDLVKYIIYDKTLSGDRNI